MLQLNEKKVVMASITGWLLVVLSPLICYFSSNPNNCSLLSRLNVSESIPASIMLAIGLILLTIATFGAYSNYPKKSDTDRTRITSWLPMILLPLAFLAVPFNTSDISFYFSSGTEAALTSRIYTENWSSANLYYCPALHAGVEGVMYGPLSVSIFKELFLITGNQPIVFIILWKMIIGSSLVGSVLLTWLIVKKLGAVIDKRSFYLLWLTQPLLLWEGLANGHFDILMEVFILLGILFALQKRWWLVIISLLIGAWLKFVPLILGPLFLVWWWQSIDKENWKRVCLETAGGTVAGIFITWLSWRPYWTGRAVLTPIILQTKWVVNSPFGIIYYPLKTSFIALFHDSAHFILTRLVHLLLLAVVIFMLWPLLKQAWLIVLKKMSWTSAEYLKVIFIGMIVYLAVWQKSFWPWYITWLLPLGFILLAISSNSYLRKINLWISIAPVYFYLIWFLNHFIRITDAPSELWFWCVVVALVWVFPVIQLFKWRKDEYRLS